jgi:hypothetical protein
MHLPRDRNREESSRLYQVMSSRKSASLEKIAIVLIRKQKKRAEIYISEILDTLFI